MKGAIIKAFLCFFFHMNLTFLLSLSNKLLGLLLVIMYSISFCSNVICSIPKL